MSMIDWSTPENMAILIAETAPVKNTDKKMIKDSNNFSNIGPDLANIYKFLTTGNSKMKAYYLPGLGKTNLTHLRTIMLQGQKTIYLQDVKWKNTDKVEELELKEIIDVVKYKRNVMCIFPPLFVTRGQYKGNMRFPPKEYMINGILLIIFIFLMF